MHHAVAYTSYTVHSSQNNFARRNWGGRTIGADLVNIRCCCPLEPSQIGCKMKNWATITLALVCGLACATAMTAAADITPAGGLISPARKLQSAQAVMASCQCGDQVYSYYNGCRCWCAGRKPNSGRRLEGLDSTDGAMSAQGAQETNGCECYGTTSNRIYSGSGCWCRVPC